MRLLFLSFLIIPIVEMVILIEVGSQIGALYTVLLVLLTAIIGVSLLKQQGLQTLLNANQKVNTGQLPVNEIGEGMMLAVAGALLLTPGFVTDAFGFLMLTPPVRQRLVKTWAKKILEQSTVTGFQQGPAGGSEFFYSRTEFHGDPERSNRTHNPDVIEGEYKEINPESDDQKQ